MDKRNNPEGSDIDLFKEEFKYYKLKFPANDLSRVLDFQNAGKFPQIVKYSGNVRNNVLRNSESGTDTDTINRVECLTCKSCGLNHHANWNVYGHVDIPGIIFITNPFTLAGQKMWIKKCLIDYPQKPNVTNVDITTKEKKGVTCKDDFEYLKKLRWTTLGYHHNWDTKIYAKDNWSPFPPCLSKLTKHISTVLGNENFQPEAAIINYYHMNSTLSGHVDCSEKDLSSPLFSISFGQNAIFLIGGKTKCVRPTPMFIKSGDIVIMSKESRLSYHGVPRILKENNKQKWNNDKEDTQWQRLDSYVRQSRINMNIRQVVVFGQVLE